MPRKKLSISYFAAADEFIVRCLRSNSEQRIRNTINGRAKVVGIMNKSMRVESDPATLKMVESIAALAHLHSSTVFTSPLNPTKRFGCEIQLNLPLSLPLSE